MRTFFGTTTEIGTNMMKNYDKLQHEVEGHLTDWYYHDRVIMGTTLSGEFIQSTALGMVWTQFGLIICCTSHKNWMCRFEEEINVKAMSIKSVDT